MKFFGTRPEPTTLFFSVKIAKTKLPFICSRIIVWQATCLTNVALSAHCIIFQGVTKINPLKAFHRSLAIHCPDRNRPVTLDTIISTNVPDCPILKTGRSDRPFRHCAKRNHRLQPLFCCQHNNGSGFDFLSSTVMVPCKSKVSEADKRIENVLLSGYN